MAGKISEGVLFFGELESTLKNCKLRGIAMLVKSWIPQLQTLMDSVKKANLNRNSAAYVGCLLDVQENCKVLLDEIEKVPNELEKQKKFIPNNTWFDCHGEEYWNETFSDVSDSPLNLSLTTLKDFCVIVDSLVSFGCAKGYYQSLAKFTLSLEDMVEAAGKCVETHHQSKVDV